MSADLKKHFGEKKLPPLLVELFAFDGAGTRDWFSGNIELDDSSGGSPCSVLTGVDASVLGEVGARIDGSLGFFARDPDGSLYGLWFHEGTGEPPVVYVNSEGADTAVLADNIRTFVSLLLLDRDDLGQFYGVPRDEDAPHAARYEKFAEWAKAKKVSAPADPEQLVEEARKKHPDFGKWFAEIFAEADAAKASARKQ